MTTIRIEPSDLHFPIAELEPLRKALTAEGHDVEISEHPTRGYAVTWWEVFHFFLGEVAEPAKEEAIGAVIGAFVVWARNRFRAGGDGREGKAPKSATIYGPDGVALREVTLRNADEEPEISE